MVLPVFQAMFALSKSFGSFNLPRIYIDHDVMHGVTFPPYEFQKYLTHPGHQIRDASNTSGVHRVGRPPVEMGRMHQECFC